VKLVAPTYRSYARFRRRWGVKPLLRHTVKKYGKKMDNVLDPADQLLFDLGRVAGVSILLQCFWVYNRAIDVDGLRQFHDHLQRGRLSRRIERSPLRFGRHRWISPNGSADLEIVASSRPREEFDAWLYEQAKTPLDCERGPGWHLAALPFSDGGAGVSLVISHCLTDGIGLVEALADAALGRDDPISWPAAASRRRWQALREDARQTARDIPTIGRAVVAAIRLARRSRGSAEAAGPLPAPPPALSAGAEEPVTLPTATIFVDAKEWEARAHSLGGTSNALLVGLAARLAQRRGRVSADGSVVIRMPVDERVAGDTRANATSHVDVTVDPAPATADLREIRAAIKQALIRHRQVPYEEQAAMSIVPLLALLPTRLLRRFGGGSTTPVVSSNLGVVNPAASRADGTDADYFAMKWLYPCMTKAMADRFGEVQMFLAGGVHRQVFVAATAYQPGRQNSTERLRQDLSTVLNDFSLTGAYL
jgi:diacylglycerol O-acyltransferase